MPVRIRAVEAFAVRQRSLDDEVTAIVVKVQIRVPLFIQG